EQLVEEGPQEGEPESDPEHGQGLAGHGARHDVTLLRAHGDGLVVTVQRGHGAASSCLAPAVGTPSLLALQASRRMPYGEQGRPTATTRVHTSRRWPGGPGTSCAASGR